jgi:cobalt-zinc-cadmium resistance protein CzcA
VPDITNNQVQVITQAPSLAAQEVEQFITFLLENSLRNIPGAVEIRSISRFGLSVITVVFDEDTDTYLARQLTAEQLKIAEGDVLQGAGTPQMAPITTSLGEIYQYVLRPQKGFEHRYDPMELRSIQDWLVKRQLSGIEGVVEVSSVGGFVKQYEVSLQPERLQAMNISLHEVFDALAANNANTGGSYIERNRNAYFIRGEGMVQSLQDIEKIVIKNVQGVPVLVKHAADVKFGHAQRYGAMTSDGKGEVVGGIALMLKGASSEATIRRVKERVAQVQKSLPEGLVIDPYLDRTTLIDKAIRTVRNNLIEGGLIVIFVLVLLLGNLRAGLVVASVIPLSMLFALGMMNVFGVSANLMSLGAIDFGLIVDGAVIIVESIVHRLHHNFGNTRITQEQMNDSVYKSATNIRKSAAFGEIIILIVYLPILALEGIEGKMFHPMALTVSFAILGALILSLTYVPMASSLFLSKKVVTKRTISDRIMDRLYKFYAPVIR